ncbi:NUDIX domain-containing protein [Streptomyces sp. NBC_01275]|uniref:NUDIX domain-containing protein n=1 Tax=Streptomyces sp. NBC_01275 TaxID=2903807 RepID=UPI0022598DE9|nr:NUDIX domain-containing protein [Streptomyces sp. NBC_01275]MCX4767849.1 NUDIX domain-containing protein [Streptomyces sp. NBC_01275]
MVITIGERLRHQIERFFAERLAVLEAAGIGRDRLVIDPRLGYFLPEVLSSCAHREQPPGHRPGEFGGGAVCRVPRGWTTSAPMRVAAIRDALIVFKALGRDQGRCLMNQREAIVAVVRRGERVLVIQRGPGARLPGYWAPLSGTLEPGEGQEECLVREVREEVGLRVSPLAKVWESQTPDGKFRLHWWMAEAEDVEVVMDPGEVSDVCWVTPEEFSDVQPVFEADREFFDRVLPGLGGVPGDSHATKAEGHSWRQAGDGSGR